MRISDSTIVLTHQISFSFAAKSAEYSEKTGFPIFVGISLAYGVLVIAICYASLALIFRLDDRRFM